MPKNAISDAKNFLKMENFHFPNIWFMTKKDPDFVVYTSFIWLVVICHLYINLCIYKKVVGVAFLFLLLVLRQKEVAQSAVLFFKKCQNRITSKFLYLEGILVIV